MSATQLPKDLAVFHAQTDEERARVFAFRHDVLVDELGYEGPDVDSDRGHVSAPEDDIATLLCLTSGDKILASLRLDIGVDPRTAGRLSEPFSLGKFGEFPREAVSVTSSIVVAAAWRGTPALSLLLAAAYKLCRVRKVRFDLTHCPTGRAGLFERLGYRPIGDNFAMADGLQTPLCQVLGDMAHLRAVGSPFVKFAREYAEDATGAAWFRRTFPEAEHNADLAAMDEDRFWTYLTQRLHQAPLHGIPLLHEVPLKDAKRLVASGTVIRVRAGEQVINAGERGHEMFVILRGAVEVRTNGPHDHVLARLDRGELFGEIGFLSDTARSATVVALSDIELLALSQGFFRKLIAEMPAVASTVLLNLSVILCQRLVKSNQVMGGSEDLVARADASSVAPALATAS